MFCKLRSLHQHALRNKNLLNRGNKSFSINTKFWNKYRILKNLDLLKNQFGQE